MKKIIYIFMFILISINLSANMMGDSKRPPHHMKHYMREINNKGDLTPEQHEDLMGLRVKYMRKQKKINTRLRDIRGEMNHCMRDRDEESEERYDRLREEREVLRKERGEIKEEFQEEIAEIIKKQ